MSVLAVSTATCSCASRALLLAMTFATTTAVAVTTTIASACPFCMTMMDDAAKVKGVEETVAVKDFAEIVAERMQ